MSRIIDEILDFVYKEVPLEDISVVDARIGAVYSGVILSNGYAGIAWIVREKLHIHPLDEAGFLTKINVKKELKNFIFSENPFKRSFGFSILNALITSTLKEDVRTGDALDAISIRDGDTITLIGAIGPFINELSRRNVNINLFEKGEVKEEFRKFLRLNDDLDKVLLETDILILTGVTVENFSIDGIVSLPTKAREKIISGPTTPMVKGVFKKRGFNLVAGVRIVNPKMMIKTIGEGGGTKVIIKNSGEKVFFRL